MAITLIHPGYENFPQPGVPAARLATFKGKRIGLVDISKPGGQFFLDRLEQILTTRYAVGEVLRFRKPTYTKNAPPPLLEQLRGMDAVIEALAD